MTYTAANLTRLRRMDCMKQRVRRQVSSALVDRQRSDQQHREWLRAMDASHMHAEELTVCVRMIAMNTEPRPSLFARLVAWWRS